jgi:predicted GNAT family acetyltransferase
LTPDTLRPELAIDRLVEAVAHLYRYKGAQRPADGALHHIQYEQPVFDIQITDEFFVLDADPDEVVQAVGAAQTREHHCLTVFHQPAQATITSYADRGYRLAERLFLMACDIYAPAVSQAALAARRVTTVDEAAWINTRRGKPIVAPHHLSDPGVAYYYLMLDGALAATGILVHAEPQVAYIADLFTFPAYRGQGIATELMQRMLVDAAAAGARQSLLLATERARRLYAKLGYSDLLFAQVFVPV